MSSASENNIACLGAEEESAAAAAAAEKWAASLGGGRSSAAGAIVGDRTERPSKSTCWAVWHEELAAFEVLQPRGDALRSMASFAVIVGDALLLPSIERLHYYYCLYSYYSYYSVVCRATSIELRV